METIQKKTLEYLPNVVDALKNDVPKRDYRRLQKGIIQRASAELGVALSKIQGANKDNVKRLRQCLTFAHRREFEELHNDEILQEALTEYEVLRKTFFTIFGEKEKLVEALKGSEYRYPVPGKWKRIEQQYSTDTDLPLTSRTPRTARGGTQMKDGTKTSMSKGRDSVKSLAHLEPEGYAAMSPILEDPLRKQIAIQFRQLYDHHRAAAFTDLITIGALFEDDAVRILCKMLKTSDVEIPPYMMKDALRLCKTFRKQASRISIDKVKKCAEVTWLMAVQEPQMAFYWPEVGEMRPDMFKVYPGHAVFDEFCVWPALLYSYNGVVAVKGYVQPMAPELPMPPRKAQKTPDSNKTGDGGGEDGMPLPASPMSEESINIS
ncbi:hypothetical protein KUTeg_024773 [Tegillarca granosa]|uniref:Mitochondria-eating protein C-terminal domain-containing protein n=1 Tax=Tegillarca granosa TaxID=220873 RepID=A0ABQ9E3S6_TEGGR|nr:hypothetical protein KUTeg_024773 [Tegillarca granosa]